MSPVVRRNAWIAFIAVCVIWGTTYLAIKVALETIPPFLMGGIRYVIAGTVLGGILVARGEKLPPLTEWGSLAWLGFLMIGLGNGGVNWAEQYLASGIAAVVIATSPFWMVAVDAMLPGGEKFSTRKIIGLSIGFGGIVLLVWPDITLAGADGRMVLLGILALQIACAGWAVASSYTKRHAMSRNVLVIAAVQMFFGGLFMTLVGTTTGEWSTISFNPRTTSALLYLIVAGSLVAFAAYSYALRHLPITTVSLYTYVNPVIAVALGTLLLGEPFRLSMVVAAGIIVVGMLVVRSR
ncbi:MAG: multidrug DMT transporter permease [Acidimicrobiia bacterium]|nr:multidrug DMT transporter permease [Acidimicrobiia bacterium]